MRLCPGGDDVGASLKKISEKEIQDILKQQIFLYVHRHLYKYIRGSE